VTRYAARMLRRIALGLLSFAVLAVSVSAATFTVTSAADSGAGSFDQAILDANATPGLDNIHFNIGGGGPQVITTGPIPVITDAVVIDGTTQPGYAGTPIVTLDGNDVIGAELRIQSASPSTIRGLAIVDMLGAGVRVENGGATITGNYIGVNASGLVADGNNGGIEVYESVDGVVITGNVISGNAGNGIQLSGTPGVAASDDNIVQGNIIGLDASGVNDLGNSLNGIAVDGGNSNQLGGTAAGEGNVISGNGGFGIRISARGAVVTGAVGNTVQGNLIGTNGTGTAAVSNGLDGVALFGPHQTTVGGTTAGARNVISGNTNAGVNVSFDTTAGTRLAADTVITGNFIGTDINGTADLGNVLNGIAIVSSTGTIVGGAAAGAGNVISGNNLHGVSFAQIGGNPTSGAVVQGNRIGTDVTGTAALPNTGNGVVCAFAGTQALLTDNTIGGTGAGEGNRIWFNGGDGVAVLFGAGNPILGNSIDLNGGLGIDLGPNGVATNDPGDTDTGPNNGQNYPVLTAVTVTASTTVTGTLNSTPARTFRIEFFSSPAADPSGFGEGRTFLGFTTVTTDGAGDSAPISVTLPAVAPGSVVTATATDQTTQDTSEFSNAVAAVFVPATLNVDDVTVTETNSGTTDAVFTVTLDAPAPTDVTFQFSTADGTATAPSDYASTSGTGFIPQGETSTTITVPVAGDPSIEPDETFNVTITAIAGASGGDVEGQATIANDDVAPIPTLTEWLLGLMAALLAMMGMVAVRGTGT